MKLSIITTITNPDKCQYAWEEAIRNYCQLADEVIIVNGGKKPDLIEPINKIKWIQMTWPHKWNWSELPKHLNAGLEAATGDWVLKLDIDQLIHENDHATIRQAMEENKNWLALSLVRSKIMNRTHYALKTEAPVLINKKIACDTIKFGKAVCQETDWCYPILVSGTDMNNKIPAGKLLDEGLVKRTGIYIWDYDCFFRTKLVQKREFWRFAQAYLTKDDTNKNWGTTKDEAWLVWWNMMKGRLQKLLLPIALDAHPEAIRDRIKNMVPTEWGFNNWKRL